MADEDDYGALEDFDFDWVYVEDDFPLSDELAEMQIPEPGYAGTNYEIYLEHDDMDIIGYWDELEYVDDEYWDDAQLGALATQPTAKRKRGEKIAESPGAKRRRVIMESYEIVKYVSWAERIGRYKAFPPRSGKVKPFALLPDWKERFANDTGVITKKTMPAAMKKAAEAQDEDTPPNKRQFDAMAEDGDDEEWEDDDEGEAGDEEAGEMAGALASLDPETLKTILQQNLAQAGLGDLGDEEKAAFMATISKMLSGEEGDDATSELANSVLGRVQQGTDSKLSEFLQKEGITFEDDDDASSVATTELPTSSRQAPKSGLEVSPHDSAIEVLTNAPDTKDLAMHGSSPSTSTRKRAAPSDIVETGFTKRKRVTFDVPSASQPEDEIVENGEKQTLNDDISPQIEPEVEATTSEDPLMSETTVQSTTTKSNTKTAATKSASAKRVKGDKSTASRSDGAKNYAKPTAAASAKQTRKRKAEADDEDVENIAPQQKKPARKAAKSEPQGPVVEPPARRTRSAKAKAGK